MSLYNEQLRSQLSGQSDVGYIYIYFNNLISEHLREEIDCNSPRLTRGSRFSFRSLDTYLVQDVDHQQT